MFQESRPAQFTARWKQLEDDAYRVICGNPLCPGSLGQFFFLTFDRLGTTDLETLLHTQEELRAGINLIVAERANATTMQADASAQAWQSMLDRLRESVESLQMYIDSKKQVAKNEADNSERYIEAWVMRPDQPTDNFKVSPIYYGYADTGYRISFTGKRTKRGLRISRRRYSSQSNLGKVLESRGLESEWTASGQSPCPPCNIWCPVCDALNFVPLPDGFEIDVTTSQ